MLREATGNDLGKLATTHPRHLSTRASSTTEDSLLYRIPMMSSLDGNTVDESVEVAEFAENALHFQAAVNFLDGRFRGLISVIKGE